MSGAKPPTLPLSKARRELAELLEHARTLEADGDTTRLRLPQLLKGFVWRVDVKPQPADAA